MSLCAVSTKLRSIGLDDDLWRSRSFDHSASEYGHGVTPFLIREMAKPRDESHPLIMFDSPPFDKAAGPAGMNFDSGMDGDTLAALVAEGKVNEKIGRVHGLANWDPAYPGEKIDWYGEYLARHGSISFGWLQPPEYGGETSGPLIQARGMGLYSRGGVQQVVSPLEDGSICLWEIGTPKRAGLVPRGIVGRTRPALLSIRGHGGEGFSSQAGAVSSTVVECVSVDSSRGKAYVAVQNIMTEVDLNTLAVSSRRKYPFSISALSESTEGLPLTIGTTFNLHLYDHRDPFNSNGQEMESARVDNIASFPTTPRPLGTWTIASLPQSGPLSILHLSPQGLPTAISGEIYVAGRSPSVLVYDRRTFPQLHTTFDSGARLCSLTSLPYSYHSLEAELMRDGKLSLGAVHEAKTRPGDRVIGCGEYKGAGSLEIYGLSANRDGQHGLSSSIEAAAARTGHTSTFTNRMSRTLRPRPKLLSVITHGTRLVVSDSDGIIRWLERDGATYVRAWNINPFRKDLPMKLQLASLLEKSRAVVSPRVITVPDTGYRPGPQDVARKLLSTGAQAWGGRVEDEEILVWSGERIGLMSFSPKARVGDRHYRPWHRTEPEFTEEGQMQRFEKLYGKPMRRVLEGQSDDFRWQGVYGLG